MIENSVQPMYSPPPAKVCILGLGQVGLPTAKYCLNKGLPVLGYDISHIAIERAKGFLELLATGMKYRP